MASTSYNQRFVLLVITPALQKISKVDLKIITLGVISQFLW
jgi:hypothetical protein